MKAIAIEGQIRRGVRFSKPKSGSTAPFSQRLIAMTAFVWSMVALGQAAPIVIAPTTNTGLGATLTDGLYGSIYNFSATDNNDNHYSVSNILNPAYSFDPTLVGSYVANTASGLSYGTPDSDDDQPLTTWLGADGASVDYNGNPHITPVFDTGTSTGTLLLLNGYIRVTPAMINVPQTYSLGLDDGGTLTINGTVVIDNSGIHGPAVVSQEVVFTRVGLYPVTLGYYDGMPTQAVLDALFGGDFLVSTANGIPLPVPHLDPTSNAILAYVNKVAGTMPADPTFNHAANALALLAFEGNVSGYENALKELSPLKYAALDSQTSSTIDFITNDLDDYLAHRRTDAGTFRAGNGVDLSGMSVYNGTVDPALQEIAGHLLAYSGPDAAPGRLSDSGNPVLRSAEEPEPTQNWNVFTRGIVVLSQNFSDSGIQHTESTSGTLQLGADYQITPHLLVGGFFDYAHSSGSLDEEGSSASANSYIPGLYASYTAGGWYANALAAGGISNFDVTRNIVFPGFDASAQASPQGEEEYGYLSGGHDFHCHNWTFGPTAGLQYVHTNTDDFTEHGAGLLDLDVNQHDDDSLRSRLGWRVYYAAMYETVLWRPFIDASWQHEFMLNSNSLTAQFDGADVGTFTVAAPGNSRDSALISAGTDIDIDKATDVFTAYRVEAGASNFFAQSVEAGVKITF